MPRICVCTPALYALLQTSLLLTTIDGADAVGGVLSTVTVPLETVDTVFVCADKAVGINKPNNKATANNVLFDIFGSVWFNTGG